MFPPSPVKSAGNSWAQSTSQRRDSSSSTNRAKYEDTKPMPLPPTSPPAMALAIPMPLSKTRLQVQPAVPKFPPSKELRQDWQQKNRAVTDPVAPDRPAPDRKLSIKTLRAKFAGEHNPNAIKEDMDTVHQQNRVPTPILISTSSSVPATLSNKAVRIMGYHPVSKDTGSSNLLEPPSSAPPTTFGSDPLSTLSEQSASPSRQAQSTPVQGQPTKRWLSENSVSSSYDENAIPLTVNVQFPISPPRSSNAMILGDGRLSPTKTGTYGLASQVEIKEGFQRVTSQHAILEHVLDKEDGEQNNNDRSRSPAPLTGSSTLTNPFVNQNGTPGPYLQPTIYSPSIYEGVWENDPNVGYSLPPFSPSQTRDRLASNIEVQRPGDLSQGSEGTIPMAYDPRVNNFRQTSVYAPSLGSANSWAASGHRTGNSSTRSTMHQSAIVPRLFAPDSNNFVPPPPLSFPGFQPSMGPASPGLAHLEATLHHHIDACFERLSRMITDKTDKVIDELIERCEKLEAKLSDSIKGRSSQIDDVKKEVISLKDEIFAGVKVDSELKVSINGLEDTFKSLENKIEGTACHCEYRRPTDHEAGNQLHIDQHRVTQDTLSVPDHRNTTASQLHTSNVSALSTPHRRNHINRSYSRRSSALSGSSSIHQNETYDSQDIHRSHFPGEGRLPAPGPDLNLHPAFATVGMEYGMGGEPVGGAPFVLSGPGGAVYQLPDFRDGAWYQAARGARRGYG